MSNQHVGTVYAQIIEDVINSSRVDFEEGGIEEAVLRELERGWQRKLSQLQVAQFPWDPKPETEPANNAAPPTTAAPAPAPPTQYVQAQVNLPENVQQLSLPGAPVYQDPNAGQADVQIKTEPGLAKNDAPIKQEPGLASNGFPQPRPNFAPAGLNRGMAVAQQRAAQALESQYGQRAAASISALQGGMAQAPQMHPAQVQHQPQHQPQQPITAQQYRQGVAAAMTAQQQRAQQAPNPNGQGGVGQSQLDGSNDPFEGVLLQRDADGTLVEMARVDIDNLLHEKIAARAKQMEGGGLMLPLKEATKHQSLSTKKKQNAGSSQVDGPDDMIKEEEQDEDAINSDLDDTDDEQDDEEDDDESLGHIMLCMYDKVQRVKNKWKCTLKDGVLTVNGKEYVFHKATGEYEW